MNVSDLTGGFYRMLKGIQELRKHVFFSRTAVTHSYYRKKIASVFIKHLLFFQEKGQMARFKDVVYWR